MVSSCASPNDTSGGESAPGLPTPAQIIRSLDRFVIGQDRPKRDLAVAVYNHYLSLAYASHPGARHKDLGPQHILLLGPTGSGKTYLIRRIAELLDIPIVFASATALVEVGYKGESVDSLLENLVAQCGGDTQKAERGIIYIDEFDKIRKASVNTGRDVSGEGVQNALLTLLDGRRTTTGGYHASRTTLDVSKILFICTGAFSGLPRIVRQRLQGAGGFGFGAGREVTRIDIESDDDAFEQGVHEDLIQFGFIPEIVGRFAAITALRTLSEDELVRIMTEAGDSILEKQRTLFALHGIELLVPDESLRAVAQLSRQLGTGARGLVSLVRNALDDVSWRLPDLREEGVDRVVITPETVRRTGEPIMLRRGASLPPEWEGVAAPEPAGDREQTDDERPPLPDLNTLRAVALRPPGVSGELVSGGSPHGISDTTGWSPARIARRLERVKIDIGVPNTEGCAKKWWEEFEKNNRKRTALVLRVAEELLIRRATVTEFFLAYVYSNCENIQANLHYLDYTRLKKREIDEKKKQAEKDQGPKPTAGPDLPDAADLTDDQKGDPDNKSSELSRLFAVSKPPERGQKKPRASSALRPETERSPPDGLDPRAGSAFRLRVCRSSTRAGQGIPLPVSRRRGLASGQASKRSKLGLRSRLWSMHHPAGRSRPGGGRDKARCTPPNPQ